MIAGQKLKAGDGFEVALFPCEALYITEARPEPEHSVLALDFLPRDANGNSITRMPCYAPFSGTIVYTGNDHNAILESDTRVHTPDGNFKFVRVLVAHSWDEPVLNTHYNQGDLFYTTGNFGHSSGEHLHMEVAEVGSKNERKWNTSGIGLYGGVHMWNGLYVNNTALLRPLNYNWRLYDLQPFLKNNKFKWVLYANKIRNTNTK